MNIARRVLPLIALWALSFATQSARAADPPTSDERPKPATSPLAVRQEHVERMVQNLEEKFVQLAQALKETEPEQATKLAQALEQSKQSLIDDRMKKIARLLNDTQFDNATAEQQQIVTDLKRLVRILLDEDKDAEKLQAEINRLEHIKAALNQLIQEEVDEKRESERLSDKDATLGDLARRIAALEDLIKKQEGVITATGQARSTGIQALGKAAQEQRDVRKQTQKLAEEVRRPRGDDERPAAGSPAGESPPGQSPPGESPAGQPPMGQAPPDPSGASPPSGAEPAEKPLTDAVAQQKAAEASLDEGKGKAAEEREREALEHLKRALAELKQEKDRIASLPPEAKEQMAKAQDATGDKTGQLAEEMKQGGDPSDEAAGGNPGEGQVKEAQQSMKQASGALRKPDPKQAAKDQAKAVEKLKKARDEVQERLAQLRREMQAEKLAALEARFREMLQKQQPLTVSTAKIDGRREDGKLRRADRLDLARIATDEVGLAEMAEQARDIIVEDGTSVVFAHIVGELRDDLKGVGDLLKVEHTDSYAQLQQQEIERTLKELIEALEKAQKDLEQKEQQGEPEEGEPSEDNEPLLPNSAELKLLKSAQLRINRRTTAFDQARPAGALAPALQKEVRAIAERQEEVAKMADALGTAGR